MHTYACKICTLYFMHSQVGPTYKSRICHFSGRKTEYQQMNEFQNFKITSGTTKYQRPLVLCHQRGLPISRIFKHCIGVYYNYQQLYHAVYNIYIYLICHFKTPLVIVCSMDPPVTVVLGRGQSQQGINTYLTLIVLLHTCCPKNDAIRLELE